MAKIDLSSIDLSRVKKEHLVLICIILAVVIAFFFYKNIFNPLWGKTKRVSAQIEQRKRDIQKARISPQALKDLEDEIGKLKTQIDYYQKSLKAQADVPQILKELNQIAEQLKIKFVSVTPLEKEETLLPGAEEVLLQIPIGIKLQCGYHQLGMFINQVENSQRLMKISNLKINADLNNIWMHQVELAITSYNLASR